MMIDFNETNRSLTMDFNSESELYLYRWYADYLVYRLFGLVIAFLGFLGGILSVVVFRQKSLRKRSCSVYFLNLALADLLCMSCWLVHFVLPTYNLQLLTLSNIFCKMFTFSMYFAFDLANYLLTVCSIDRAACVLFPLRTRQYCHRHLAWKITIVLSIVDGLLNSHLFYGFFISKFRLTSNEIVEICHHRSDSLFYEKFFYLYDSYVDVVKTNFIPFLIMTICNAIIIHRVCRQRSSFNDENQRRCNVKSKRKQEKDRQLTLMLLASSIAFLVLTLPTEINDFIRFHSVNKSVDEKSYLVSSIFLSLAHLNYAIHFYIYTLTGEVFRRELIKIWPLRCFFSSATLVSARRTQSSFTRADRLI